MLANIGNRGISLLSASIVFGLGIVAILPQSALANFNGVHRSTFNGKERVVFPGQTPDTSIEVTTVRTAQRVLTLNNCGWGKFTESATSPVAAIRSSGSTLSIAAGTAPTCVRAVAPATGYVDSNPSDAVGTVIKAANVVWIKGGSTVGAYSIDVDTNRISRAKANACGVASLTISATRPLTTFTFAGTNYTLANLPATTNGGLICRKSSTGAIAFVPVAGF
ncbi:MAG: hypothetical protein HC916_14445 [Coleofasciculaceae cyanobacterium SM2_1_6]|nr:hypothetical protein [Coleofasciculaceae cyanobacterium SM2_1_6]